MWGKQTTCLFLLLFVTACSQAPPRRLRPGILPLSGIDPADLQSALWSPDGKTIAASYVVLPSPDFSVAKSRADLVLIDTQTWETTFLLRTDYGNMAPLVWAADSRSFTMWWSSGPHGDGIYRVGLDNPTPSYISASASASGVLSPDLQKMAAFTGDYLRILDLDGKPLRGFKPPAYHECTIDSWSVDMQQLALTCKETTGQLLENVYVLDIDSGHFIQVSNDDDYLKYWPRIAPNGQLVAYLVMRFAGLGLDEHLAISRIDRTCQWIMPIDGINAYAWSPNSEGMFIAGENGVYAANLNILFGEGFAYRKDCQ